MASNLPVGASPADCNGAPAVRPEYDAAMEYTPDWVREMEVQQAQAAAMDASLARAQADQADRARAEAQAAAHTRRRRCMVLGWAALVAFTGLILAIGGTQMTNPGGTAAGVPEVVAGVSLIAVAIAAWCIWDMVIFVQAVRRWEATLTPGQRRAVRNAVLIGGSFLALHELGRWSERSRQVNEDRWAKVTGWVEEGRAHNQAVAQRAMAAGGPGQWQGGQGPQGASGLNVLAAGGPQPPLWQQPS